MAFHLSLLHPRRLHPVADTVAGQTTKYKVLHPVLQCPLVCYSVLHPVLHPSVDTVVGQTTKYKPCHSHEAGTLEEIKEQTSKIEHLPFQYPYFLACHQIVENNFKEGCQKFSFYTFQTGGSRKGVPWV